MEACSHLISILCLPCDVLANAWKNAHKRDCHLGFPSRPFAIGNHPEKAVAPLNGHSVGNVAHDGRIGTDLSRHRVLQKAAYGETIDVEKQFLCSSACTCMSYTINFHNTDFKAVGNEFSQDL